MEPPSRAGYRRLLRGTVASSATPYGYTLTLWTTGASVARVEGGAPAPLDALLLAIGAVLAFAAMAGVAFGGLTAAMDTDGATRVRVWCSFHLVPLVLNFVTCSAMLRTVHGHAAWLLSGFAATAIYLVTVTGQLWCAAIGRQRRGRRPASAAQASAVDITDRRQ